MENMNERTTSDHIVAQALETALGSKVEKEDGKLLSSNDYTDAEKEKLAGLENYTLPDFTYRNLCLNSRGDNLNCWDDVGSRTEITLDTDKFGYTVIKTYGASGFTDWIELGLYTDQNCPALKDEVGFGADNGITRSIMISYDYYPTIDCSVGLITNLSPFEVSFRYSAKANQWNKVVHRIPAGSKIHAIQLGLALGITDLTACAYFKNIQIEYGTEATPYCYNPTLPFSLEEQIVPGEMWEGKQVYQRTFKGTVHAAVGGNYIARNCFKSTNTILVDAWGSINGEPTTFLGHNYSIPLGRRWDIDIQDDSLTYVTDFDFMGNMSYTLTVKYAQ